MSFFVRRRAASIGEDLDWRTTDDEQMLRNRVGNELDQRRRAPLGRRKRVSPQRPRWIRGARRPRGSRS